MCWFLSNDMPEIPADILDWLNNRDGSGDQGDVATDELTRVRRVVAVNKMLLGQQVKLLSELQVARNNAEDMSGYIRHLVSLTRRLGHEPSHLSPVAISGSHKDTLPAADKWGASGPVRYRR